MRVALWRCVVLYLSVNVSEEHTDSIFRIEVVYFSQFCVVVTFKLSGFET
jgi:hypothetical protein